MSKKTECVKVAVRCRPMSKDEKKDSRACVVSVDSNRGEISVFNSKTDASEPPKTFTYDCTYGPDSIQEQVYTDTGYPIVESCIQGYNGTIFAYGQTGTGKTFTMEGEETPHENRGIIPRSFEQIFYAVEQNPDTEFLIRVSFLEIYNEEIHDLLSKDAATKLDVKEKADTGFYVKDLKLQIVKSIEEMKEIMLSGRRNRHTGQTAMNRDSSRSHSIFSIVIERSEKGPDGMNHIRAGKLNLVDLAGSERQSKTQAVGDRLKEATNINKSLLTLGNVISALVDGTSTHIPYRDSKLTKLLADSLGGNTKTLMIANVGPADWNYDETITTLRYANRAKNIQNKPKINEDPKDALLREYQDEISRLRAALDMQGGGGGAPFGMGAPIPGLSQVIQVEKKVFIEDQQKIKELEDKLEKEKQAIERNAEEEIKKIEAQRNLAEDEKQRLIEKLRKQEDHQKKAKEKQQRLLKKLKQMEDKLAVGPQIMEQAVRQEQELQKANQELESRRRQEREISRKLKEKEEEQNMLEQRYSSKQEEIEAKNKKLKKIAKKVQEADQEIKDLQNDFRKEKEDMFDTIKVLTQQLKLKSLLIDAFVPKEEVDKIERRAVWDEDEDEWVLKEIRISKNVQGKRPSSAVGLKQPTSEYARIAQGLGDTNTRFRHDNILNLDLELPDRTTEDYNGFISGKIKNMINSIINDIDDDASFVPIESYPHAEEQERAKPSGAARPGSARRPGTAKKGSSDRPPSQKGRK